MSQRNYYCSVVDVTTFEVSYRSFGSMIVRDCFCELGAESEYEALRYAPITRHDLIDALASYLVESSLVYTSKSAIKADLEGAIAEYNAKFGLR